MHRICFGRLQSLNPTYSQPRPVTRERRGAFLMCPAASRPPRSVCHFVRPHKDATRSCVEEQGRGVGCLMDIPAAKVFFVPRRGPRGSRIYVFYVARWTVGDQVFTPSVRVCEGRGRGGGVRLMKGSLYERGKMRYSVSAATKHLFLDCSRC